MLDLNTGPTGGSRTAAERSGGAYGFNLKTCVDGLQFGVDPGENELAPQNAFRFFTGLVDRENALKFAQR